MRHATRLYVLYSSLCFAEVRGLCFDLQIVEDFQCNGTRLSKKRWLINILYDRKPDKGAPIAPSEVRSKASSHNAQHWLPGPFRNMYQAGQVDPLEGESFLQSMFLDIGTLSRLLRRMVQENLLALIYSCTLLPTSFASLQRVIGDQSAT
jgi:hypothetical protein